MGGLDIRWPIAFIFTIYGVILIIFGVMTDPAIFEASLGENVDLWWGAGMLAFGLFMGALAIRASRQKLA
jgi:hypothetical protein